MIEKNRALALRWMEEVWNQRRDDTIQELLHEKVVGHMEGTEVRSPVEFRLIRDSLLAAFPDMKLVVEDTLADRDAVAVRWYVTGTHRGDLLDIPASGRSVEFRGMNWIKFKDGQIIEGWDSWNLGGLLQSLR